MEEKELSVNRGQEVWGGGTGAGGRGGGADMQSPFIPRWEPNSLAASIENIKVELEQVPFSHTGKWTTLTCSFHLKMV